MIQSTRNRLAEGRELPCHDDIDHHIITCCETGPFIVIFDVARPCTGSCLVRITQGHLQEAVERFVTHHAFHQGLYEKEGVFAGSFA